VLRVGDDGHGVMKGMTLYVDEEVDGISREPGPRRTEFVGMNMMRLASSAVVGA